MDTIFFVNFNGSFNIMLLYRQRYVWADVMPKATDSCNILLYGRCYCQCGRWNNHCRVGNLLVDVITNVADGIATRVCQTTLGINQHWIYTQGKLWTGHKKLNIHVICNEHGDHVSVSSPKYRKGGIKPTDSVKCLPIVINKPYHIT